MTCDLWPFKTSSLVRLRRESNAGPLTHMASPNQPIEGFGGPMSHENKIMISLYQLKLASNLK